MKPILENTSVKVTPLSAQSDKPLTEDEPLRSLQRLFIVEDRYPRKQIAADMGCSEDLLSLYILGKRKFPAEKLPAFTLAVDDPVLFRVLLKHLPYELRPRPRDLPERPAILIMADLSEAWAMIARLSEKLMRGEPLNDQDSLELEEARDLLKEAADELVEKNRRLKSLKET